MAFETEKPRCTRCVLVIRNEEVREVVPSDYGGVGERTGDRSYDAQACPS